NPLTAVPGLVIPRRWRGYSVGYEVPLPLSREVREVLGAENDAGQRAVALDRLAGGGVLWEEGAGKSAGGGTRKKKAIIDATMCFSLQIPVLTSRRCGLCS